MLCPQSLVPNQSRQTCSIALNYSFFHKLTWNITVLWRPIQAETRITVYVPRTRYHFSQFRVITVFFYIKAEMLGKLWKVLQSAGRSSDSFDKLVKKKARFIDGFLLCVFSVFSRCSKYVIYFSSDFLLWKWQKCWQHSKKGRIFRSVLYYHVCGFSIRNILRFKYVTTFPNYTFILFLPVFKYANMTF